MFNLTAAQCDLVDAAALGRPEILPESKSYLVVAGHAACRPYSLYSSALSQIYGIPWQLSS
jgi:hypothetical protein